MARNLSFLSVWAALLTGTAATAQWRPAGATAVPARLERAFSAAEIEALRRSAEAAREIPRSTADGWSKSPVDPMDMLKVFDGLKLRQGFVLRGYVFHSTILGTGQVLAMPVNAGYPDPPDAGFAPRPDRALEDTMDAIVGDGSPKSYLVASLLRRELSEFGARWHALRWTTHTVLDANPLRVARPAKDAVPHEQPVDRVGKGELPTPGDADRWRWLEREPNQWQPRVSVGTHSVTVVFYTYSTLNREAIYRHTDTYVPGRYRCKSQAVKIAEGSRYMVF